MEKRLKGGRLTEAIKTLTLSVRPLRASKFKEKGKKTEFRNLDGSNTITKSGQPEGIQRREDAARIKKLDLLKKKKDFSR